MFSSKFFFALGLISLLSLGAVLYLQIGEMNEYNHFATLRARYFPKKAVVPEAAKDEKDSKAADKNAVAAKTAEKGSDKNAAANIAKTAVKQDNAGVPQPTAKPIDGNAAADKKK